MVSSLTVPQPAKRPGSRHNIRPSQEHLSPHQQSSTMDMYKSAGPGYASNQDQRQPFVSPNVSESWTIDDESSNSSGQDEFHLERYSQEADPKGGFLAAGEKSRGRLGSRSRKPRRPDLNIVTELPGSQARALGPGIVVEQVRAKKAATSRPKSVVSARAEHVHDPFPPARFNALADLQAAARLRHQKNKAARPQQATADKDGQLAKTSRSIDRSDRKEVVIGISIPKNEVDASNNALGDGSAITLRTPSIVITPAAVNAPWANSPPLPTPTPASSLYSAAPSRNHTYQKSSDVPPVPRMPANLNNFSKPYGNANPEEAARRDGSTAKRQDSIDSWEAAEDEYVVEPQSRFSSESQERILPSATDPTRPKSQGWWNLALSPMLSRAGTHKSTTTRTPGQDDVPPLPSAIDKRRSRSTTLDSQISPETPRRLGLAGARASTWSRWTQWEKQKDGSPVQEAAIQKAIQRASRCQIHYPGPTVPIVIPPAKPTEGLAAEYYRACAIEQLTGESYFECENHSCAQKLPALQSVYDRGVAAAASAGAVGDERSLGVADAAHPAHQKTLSDDTSVVSPEELSPNVRQADAASVLKPKAIGHGTPSTRSNAAKTPTSDISRALVNPEVDRAASPESISMPSPPKATRYPNIAAIVPPQHPVHAGATVASPGPISPEMQRTMTSQGAVPMSEMRGVRTTPQTNEQTDATPPGFYNYVNYPQHETQRHMPPQIYVYNNEYKPSPELTQKPVLQEAPRDGAKQEEQEMKPGLFARLKSCAKKRKNPTSSTTKPKKKRRCWAILIFIALLLMIIACIVLATQLTRRGDRTPSQQQWLNLTGYPPMPTGISTIIRPDLVKQQDGCVSPNLWSCSLPKENQAEVTPNDADQPNFRFEIKFRNGTVPSNMTIPLSATPTTSKRATDPFTNDLFAPNPAPPSRAEQIFLGNTTDNITVPFDGEKTPFFMTFIPTFPIDPNDPAINASTTADLNARLMVRQTNISSEIPAPDTLSDGSAAPANLLPTFPYPFAQPIRLYNRGLQDEHYGFYMYFDKSIFLSSTAPLGLTNTSSLNRKRQAPNDGNADDTNGGATRQDAKARCTFSQTRFLVRIYTNSFFPSTLLNGGAGLHNKTPSAINYTPPGSFPYPTSITLDRHGGDFKKKMVYCYGVDQLQVLDGNTKSVVAEVRNVGGMSINPAPGLVEFEGASDGFDGSAGGSDGGSGGCECSWQNFN